jgi:hypothetical protein
VGVGPFGHDGWNWGQGACGQKAQNVVAIDEGHQEIRVTGTYGVMDFDQVPEIVVHSFDQAPGVFPDA